MIIIPSRLDSTRLSKKPLAMIHGEPLIAHVFKRAQAIKPTIVATCCEEIASIIRSLNGDVVLTPKDLPTGTDRVYYVAKELNLSQDAIVTNLQGDMPYFEPELITKTLDVFNKMNVDIATAAHSMSLSYKDDPCYVKAALDFISDGFAKALYFSRSPIPYNPKQLYKHVGIYAYKLKALKCFVETPQTDLEKQEKLEQLRALHAGLSIGVALIHHEPISVDVPSDLEKAINFLTPRNFEQ